MSNPSATRRARPGSPQWPSGRRDLFRFGNLWRG